MAAVAYTRGLDLVELKRLSPPDLDPILQEEIEAWDRLLHWDFRPSAELLQRYIGLRALEGLALRENGGLIGYCYWVSEGRKALLGDLFVKAEHRLPSHENALLRGALDAIAGWPDYTAQPGIGQQGWIRRVEGQLMMLSIHGPQVLPQGPAPTTTRRFFMTAPIPASASLRPVAPPPALRYERWTPDWIGATAELIETCYRDHTDAQINDQYRTAEGARRFLDNIIHYPGCGAFVREASSVLSSGTGEALAVVLATRVSSVSGHIAQVCVHPSLRGTGVGYELVRRTMAAFVSQGAREVSLTVTASNDRALALYQRLGFKTMREFDAFVWDSG